MPTRLSIQPHLPLDALEQGYRAAKAPIARSHWPMVWLLAQGLPSERVAAVTGDTANWVRTMAQRDHQHGPAGLGDRRHRHPGAAGLVSSAQHVERAQALGPPPPDGGRWTGPTVAAWMAATLGRPVHPPRGWELLRRLGWPPKGSTALPCAGQSPGARRFSTSLPAVVRALQQAHPQERGELWATDRKSKRHAVSPDQRGPTSSRRTPRSTGGLGPPA